MDNIAKVNVEKDYDKKQILVDLEQELMNMGDPFKNIKEQNKQEQTIKKEETTTPSTTFYDGMLIW